MHAIVLYAHLNPINFSTILVKGAVIVLKSLRNLLSYFFYIKTTLISILEASYSISKVFIKLSNDNNGVKTNFIFNKLNAYSYFIPYLNSIDFSIISAKGATRVLKSLTNIL